MAAPPAIDVGRLRLRRDDALLAAALFVAAEVEVALAVHDQRVLAAGIAAVINASLLCRRSQPTAVALVVIAGFGAQTAAGVPENTQVVVLLTLLVAMYSVGAHQPIRSAVGGLCLGVALPAGLAVTTDTTPGDVAFASLLVAAPWVAGVIARRQEEHAIASETRAQLVEARAELQARQAVEDERTRIARELHDVVSHNLSVMVVQAGAAEALLAADPARARDPIHAIQDTGRHALEDMSRLLGLLRAGPDHSERSPQPALTDLDQLVERARRTGQDVDLENHGSPRQLPRGVDLSAYRIVQEALTNARRHAPGSAVRVIVHHDREALCLTVIDTGGTGETVEPRATGTQHGLVGMRERVALYGGSLSAGPHDGGWRVTASFPLEQPP